MRLSVVADLQIDKFAGPVITEYSAGMTNAMAIKEDDRTYITQRPSIDIYEQASDHVTDARGRAVFYWDLNSAQYIVNNNKIYKGSQSNVIATITAGVDRCKFIPMGSVLVLVDQENDQAWTISTADVVTQIIDPDFPVTLAYGAEVLNGSLYLLDEAGTIYNSNLEDPANWNALDYIAAERDPDGGSFIGKHHDHIVAYGPKTIEFFYDAANPVGSPLNRRQDVAYNIGCHTGASVWQEGDRAFYIGVNPSGSLGVYVLERFQPRKVSKNALDSMLTIALIKDGYSVFGTGFSAHSHTFYLLTFYTAAGDVVPELTLVYDDTSGLWGPWETSIGGHVHLPIVDWSIRNGVLPRYGEGILSNGDLITLQDDLTPQDSIQGLVYMDADYVESGYVTASGTTGTAIAMKSRVGMFDGGTNKKKFVPDVNIVGDMTPSSQALTIKWSDKNSENFNAGRVIDTSVYAPLYRCGSFRRRNYQFEYAGTERLKLEAIEINISLGRA